MAAPRQEHTHSTNHPDTVTQVPDTSHTHDNWMEARQMSCCQQTAPPQLCCSKDVTAHQQWPGARPGSPCPVPTCRGQSQSGRSGFRPTLGTEFRGVGQERLGPSYFFISLVLGPLTCDSLLWYVPSSRYIWSFNFGTRRTSTTTL